MTGWGAFDVAPLLIIDLPDGRIVRAPLDAETWERLLDDHPYEHQFNDGRP